jgi:hypothetical protein
MVRQNGSYCKGKWRAVIRKNGSNERTQYGMNCNGKFGAERKEIAPPEKNYL